MRGWTGLALALALLPAAAPAQAAQVTYGVDLSVDESTQSAPPGGSVEFRLTVRNTGSSTSQNGSSLPFSDSFTLTQDAAAEAWYAELAPTIINSLASGGTANATWRVRVPSSAVPGTPFRFQVTAASNSDPNVLEIVPLEIRVEGTPAAPALPDLTVAHAELSGLGAGTPIVFGATVRNEGGFPAAAFGVRFVLDDRLDVGTESVDGLGAGSEARVTSESWTAVPGVHTLRVSADARAAVAEADESNNDRLQTFRIAEPLEGSVPERDFYLSVAGPHRWAAPGSNVTFELRVTNWGLRADAYALRLATPPGPWNAGILEEEVALDSLKETVVPVWVQVPDGAAHGDRTSFTLSGTSASMPERTASLDLSVLAGSLLSHPDFAPTLVGAAVAFVALLGAGAWANENGRFRFFGSLLPLYARLHPDRLLDNAIRARIHDAIRDVPGITYGGLRRALQLPNGTLTHHLVMLERQGFVAPRRDGFHKRFFPKGHALHLEAWGSGPQRSILELLANEPGLSQQDVARRLRLSKQLAHYHVRTLELLGRVYVERDGRVVRCYAGPRIG